MKRRVFFSFIADEQAGSGYTSGQARRLGNRNDPCLDAESGRFAKIRKQRERARFGRGKNAVAHRK